MIFLKKNQQRLKQAKIIDLDMYSTIYIRKLKKHSSRTYSSVAENATFGHAHKISMEALIVVIVMCVIVYVHQTRL